MSSETAKWQMKIASCKLYIFTTFNTGSSADERREMTEFVSIHSWTFTVSCYTAVYKKIQKLQLFFKRKDFVLFSAGAKYKTARTQASELKSLQFSRKQSGLAPRISRCKELPWLSAGLNTLDTLLAVFCCKLSQGGGSRGARISYCLFCGVIPISV